MHNLSIIVCQHGARHRYAVPRIFEKAGMLAALYTDSSEYSLLGKCAKWYGANALPAAKRLANRRICDIPRDKIFSSDSYNIYEIIQKILGRNKSGLSLFQQRDRILSKKMVKWGTQNANLLYTMYCDNLDFVRWVKMQGLSIAVDVYINPRTHEIMQKEYAEFPNWERCWSREDILLENSMWQETVDLADLLLCPSEWVAEGVYALNPEAREKIRIVPYGCSIDYGGRVNTPIRGRVLFAGGCALRKGLHYLAKAASVLKTVLPVVEVRVAGMLPSSVFQHPLCKDLNFLGKLSADQMKQEYLSADLVVLPALSEGFAGVVAEAIGAGCPVIVTPEAGSPVVNGREGLVVPSKNVDALVSAIQNIVERRNFRNHCANECLKKKSFYSYREWSDRLIKNVLLNSSKNENP